MKIFTGKVISNKLPKTAAVEVVRVIVHPIYGKRVRLSKKYQVHDELGAQTGQQVKFVASKPYSKTKRWKIIEIVKENETKKAVKTTRERTNKK